MQPSLFRTFPVGTPPARRFAQLLLLGFMAGPAAGGVPSKRAAKPAETETDERRAAAPRGAAAARRTVTVTDDTRDVEIHVANGSPTSLIFPAQVARTVLADAKGYIQTPQKADRIVVLLPQKDILPGDAVSLQVILTDGTFLSFVLSSPPGSWDLTVEVDVQRKAKASADSPEALKAQLAESQSRLDTCEQSAGDLGARKVGEFILRQEPSKPSVFVVETHSIHHNEKHERIVVRLLRTYRLFDVSYLVLTAQNRDPSKLWVLDRAEVSIKKSDNSVEVNVLDVAQELSQGIPPNETSRMVITYKTPEQANEHRFALCLREKDGNRHVCLDDVKL